jgi:hypothetical protein
MVAFDSVMGNVAYNEQLNLPEFMHAWTISEHIFLFCCDDYVGVCTAKLVERERFLAFSAMQSLSMGKRPGQGASAIS